MIIVRPEQEKLINSAKWVLVYGRRKTGKTFLCTHFKQKDEYFFVKRDKSVMELNTQSSLPYPTFREIFARDLSAGKEIVVDEFHRLGEDFQDTLHSIEPKGQLTLVSSTLHMSKKMVGTSSPLLGKFGEVNIKIIDLLDVVNKLKKVIKNKKQLMETSLLLREPLMINFFKNNHLNFLISGIKLTVPALIGEIFTEEDRKLSAMYEGIIRATAIGKWSSGQMSTYLFSNGLLKKDDPSLLSQYLINLVEFGILSRVRVWKRNRIAYRHISPLTHLYYYLDEKYSIGDRDVPESEANRYVKDVLPHLMEDNIQEMIAKKFGLSLFIHHDPDNQIDGIFTRFKKPSIALEVKWKKKVLKKDIRRAEESLGLISVPRKILFVPDKAGLQSDKLEIMDISDLVN